MSLGENIKRFRKLRKMDQEELAAKVGVTRPQISNIERGKRSTSPDRIAKIAQVLGVQFSDLYDQEDKVNLEDDAWLILNEELKRDGLDPDTVRKWVKLAKQFSGQNENND